MEHDWNHSLGCVRLHAFDLLDSRMSGSIGIGADFRVRGLLSAVHARTRGDPQEGAVEESLLGSMRFWDGA